MKPIVIGIGEFLWDCLPDGKKAGGAPVNFAYHATQNGVEGWAVSAVGNDELGKELMRVTREHGINTEVGIVNHPTGTVKVDLVDGQPEYTICEGVAWDYIPVTDAAKRLVSKAGAISFGTLAQRSEVSRNSTRELIGMAPDSSLIVYDINLRQNFYSPELIRESLSLSNVFKINDEELYLLKPFFGIDKLSDEDACRYFVDRFHLRLLVLTGGAQFSSIYTPDNVSTIKTPKVDVVDTVGAGDAFSGALIASLLKGCSVKEAHMNAVETAAYVCTQSGAWTPIKR